MAFPTVTVTPGTGATINTLPNAGQATATNSLPVVLASDQPALTVTGPATDAQMRATPIPISVGEVEVKNDVGNPLAVSATALPLPAGASVSAKQAALGIAGTPSVDVLTVQGAANGTPQPVTDANSAAIGAPTAVSPSDIAAFTAPRLGLTILATVAGNIALAFANSASMTIPVAAGLTVLPLSPTKIMATGTTVTATFYLNN